MPEEIRNPLGKGAEHGGTPRRASAACDGADPVAELAAGIGPGPFALIIILAAISADLPAILRRAREAWPRTGIAGCTTAGEICEGGYADGHIVAIAFPVSDFAAETVVINPVDAIDSRLVVSQLQQARRNLLKQHEDFPHELAVLMVDGLSGREEQLIASLAGGLGPVPTVGGSAGDNREFNATHVFAQEAIHDRAAVLCLLRSKMRFKMFSFDGTRPSRTQMVVTRADTARRAILSINDEPAAQEYARLLNVPAEHLGPEIFATRPVLVRAGGHHHVRSIRKVAPDGSLIFFGAVAEGMVLTLSEECDIAAHLDDAMQELCRERAPGMILGFDCIFRRIAGEGMQQVARINRILDRHRVAGFSTYGEQINSMHVNQTFTGVAFYDAEDGI